MLKGGKRVTVPIKYSKAYTVGWSTWDPDEKPKEIRNCVCPVCGRKSAYEKVKKTPIPWCKTCLERAFRKLRIPRMKDAGPVKAKKAKA